MAATHDGKAAPPPKNHLIPPTTGPGLEQGWAGPHRDQDCVNMHSSYSLLQFFLCLNLKLVSELLEVDAETLDPFVYFCFLTNHIEQICFSPLFVSVSGTSGRMASQSIEAAALDFVLKTPSLGSVLRKCLHSRLQSQVVGCHLHF